MPTYDFAGQVALVTGAGAGLGSATARAFAESGASVVLADVDRDAVEAVSAELNESGLDTIAVGCDVADEKSVAAAVRRAVDRYGRLDMAFNNAGIQIPLSDSADEELAQFEKVHAVNLHGVWACMKHELKQMRLQGSGAIVNCSSLGGLVGVAGRASYHSSKHGVIGLTQSAALQYAPRGVRINAICPGTIVTPTVRAMFQNGELDRERALSLTPIGRLGAPEEIASAVLWLCSPGASFVVGVALPVDGGYVTQ